MFPITTPNIPHPVWAYTVLDQYAYILDGYGNLWATGRGDGKYLPPTGDSSTNFLTFTKVDSGLTSLP
jgi:hypothetical protein